jgi:hypothetical protein
MTDPWAVMAAVFTAIFLAYEIYCMAKGRPTLSRAFTDLSRRHPLVGFLLGCLFGGLAIHFFTQGMQCFIEPQPPAF